MKRLSYWAATNPWKARIIITISHVLILSLGWYTGMALNQMNFILPGVLLFLFTTCYLLSAFFYPAKNEKRKLGIHRFYNRQKFCDFSVTIAAWLMIICVASNKNLKTGFFNYSFASSIESTTVKKETPTAAEILESLKYRDKSTLTRMEKRILKKEFLVQLKKHALAKVTGDKKASDQTGLIILAIVGALGLAYLVGAISCNLSCNGNDGAAVLVALLGTAAIIVGLIFVIKAIKKKQKLENDAKLEKGF